MTRRFTRLRTVATREVVGIGFCAVLTIGLALSLNGHALGHMSNTEVVSFVQNPSIHLYSLVFVAILLSGLAYAHTTSTDLTAVTLVKNVVVGVGLATGIILLTGETGVFANIVYSVTGRPEFIIIAGIIGLLYFGILRTDYDWIGMNIAIFLCVPPVIAGYSQYSPVLVSGGLVVTAVLDYFAVHKSTVMQQYAKSMLPYRIPLAFFIPTTADSVSQAIDNDFKGIRMLGVGDAVIPGIFIVSVSKHFTIVSVPVIAALVGYSVAYILLTMDLFDRTAYAGLPFLNTGVLLGAAIGVVVV